MEIEVSVSEGKETENELGRIEARRIIESIGVGTRFLGNSDGVRSEREDDILTGLRLIAAAIAVFYVLFVRKWEILPLAVPITCAWIYIHWFGMKLFVRRE